VSVNQRGLTIPAYDRLRHKSLKDSCSTPTAKAATIHQFRVDKREIKISEENRHQRYKPEVRQGYWKHIKTLAGATQDTETYRWEDYITPTRQATQRERIRFADWV
jgi:hypothetical protein